MKNNSWAKISLMLIVVMSITLPSGSINGLNIKIIASIFCALFTIHAIRNKKTPKKYITTAIAFLAIILLYSLVSIANDIPKEQIASHATAVASLFFIIYIPSLLINHNLISAQEVIKTSLMSVGAFSALKILIVMAIWNGTPAGILQLHIESIFGTSFIGLDAGVFYRVHLPIDYLLPISIYYLIQNHLQLGKPSKKISAALLCLFISAAIISYSRIIYAYVAISLLAPLITSRITTIGLIKLLTAIPILAILVFSTKYSEISGFLSNRYSGAYADNSDATRKLMFSALSETFQQYPLLGRGLGAGALNYTNMEKLPWYFELQWLSFAMQFGIIGILIIATIAASPLITSLRLKPRKYHLSISALYLTWLGVGIFNGFMLTSAGGIIFLFFLILTTPQTNQKKNYA